MGLQHCRRVGFMSFIFVLIMSVMVSRGTADTDKEKDIQECAEQLAGLATCLPYVGGDAKAPTPDCCSGLKQVLQKNKKCLCVIVKDRNDPELGININATLALGLPSVCHAPANISQCPALLHLAPNSTEAQVFYQFAHSSNATSASSPAASGNSTSSRASSDRTSAEATSDGGCSGKRRLGLDVVVGGGVLLWTITSHLFMDVEYF